MTNSDLLVPVFFLAVFVRNGGSIRCFSCSSDMFDQCEFSVQSLHMKECGDSPPPGVPDTYEPFCKLQRQRINNQDIVSRTCTWKDPSSLRTECPFTIHLTYCDTCNDKHGCNDGQIPSEQTTTDSERIYSPAEIDSKIEHTTTKTYHTTKVYSTTNNFPITDNNHKQHKMKIDTTPNIDEPIENNNEQSNDPATKDKNRGGGAYSIGKTESLTFVLIVFSSILSVL